LLDGNNNTQIGIAIRESAPTVPVLLEYIRTPGLIIGLRWKDKDGGNKEKILTEDNVRISLHLTLSSARYKMVSAQLQMDFLISWQRRVQLSIS